MGERTLRRPREREQSDLWRQSQRSCGRIHRTAVPGGVFLFVVSVWFLLVVGGQGDFIAANNGEVLAVGRCRGNGDGSLAPSDGLISAGFTDRRRRECRAGSRIVRSDGTLQPVFRWPYFCALEERVCASPEVAYQGRRPTRRCSRKRFMNTSERAK